MQRVVALVVPVLVSVAAACGAPLDRPPPVVDARGGDPAGPAVPDDAVGGDDRVCEDGVCVDAATQARLADVRAALDACVPAAGVEVDGDEVLAVAGVGAAVGEFGDELRVTLANVGVGDVLTYPGVLVQVGAGPIDVGRGTNTLFGLPACDQNELAVPFSWTTDEPDATATVTVSATNELGEVEADAIVVEIVRAED